MHLEKLAKKCYVIMTILITILMITIGYLYTNQLEAILMSQQEKQLLDLSSLVERSIDNDELDHQINAISHLPLSNDEKTLKINHYLQPIIEKIPINHGIIIGIYSRDVNRIIARKPFVESSLYKTDFPTEVYNFYKNGMPIVSSYTTTIEDESINILNFKYPILYQERLIGHAWTSVNLEQINSIIRSAILKVVVGFSSLWLMCMVILFIIFNKLNKIIMKFNIQVLNEDGRDSIIHLELLPIFDGFEKLKQRLEKEASEKEAREKETIFNCISDGLYTIDHQWRVQYANPVAVERWKSLGVVNYKDKLLLDILPGYEKSAHYKQLLSVLGEKQPQFLEESSPLFPGRSFFMSNYPMDNGVIIYSRDITDKILLEKNKHESYLLMHEQLRLLELDSNATIIRDLNCNIIFWNEKAQELYGYTADYALGKCSNDFLKTFFPIPLDDIMAILVKNDRWEGELTHTKADGTLLSLKSCWIVRRDIGGDPEAILEVSRDITNEKEMGRQMYRLNQLDSVGQIAAAIGHEVRNPLTYIKGTAQRFMLKPELAKYKESFEFMVEEVERANKIISDFLSVSKAKTSKREVRNLNKIIGDYRSLIEAESLKQGKNFIVISNIIPDLLLDVDEIRQLLLNLVNNGFEAMTNGKNITVRTESIKEEIILSVEDEGSGIPEEIREKIGNPFFSTKDNGTGLGLSVCYGIAKRHNAKIEFSTSPKGTIFRVIFREDHTVYPRID